MRMKTAIIIGASSGIGKALAVQLARDGWRLVLAARREDLLTDLVQQIGPSASALPLNLFFAEEARDRLATVMDKMGGADLVVISAGIGDSNPDLVWAPDRDTIAVNVVGFAALAQLATERFLKQGHGHLVGVSSVAKLRGAGEAASYAASKAFVSTYLDGLRDKVRSHRRTITVTEICPGFVETAMMKADKPFWIASPEQAAAHIIRAIQRRDKHVYVTRRWGLIGVLLKILPRPG